MCSMMYGTVNITKQRISGDWIRWLSLRDDKYVVFYIHTIIIKSN